MPSTKEWKRFLLGRALHNEETAHQRLSNPVALAVFASDALSSVAYAGQEILIILALAGAGALHLAWPIALGIAGLLTIVVLSYRQTIKSYPHGGGSYIVTKYNLGKIPSLVAGASLLIDYILTAAVSISAGTAAITSAFPPVYEYRVFLALGFLLILAYANLRGTRESGALFTAPTYAFVVLLGGTILFGIFRYIFIGPEAIRVPLPAEAQAITANLTLFLIARAFSSGCTAMTGVEAIANGVQAFKEPEWKNARRTLSVMATILLTLFLGLSWLTVHAGVHPSETETVISQIARQLYGGENPLYYLLSFSTMAILVLAANTAYADFPRLASFLAADDYLPRRFKELGHRLVFSNGVVVLTAAAALLIVAFRADTTSLIPLYAVGVFTSFTLSQTGMVLHHLREREPQWVAGTIINVAGAIATAGVLLVIAITKFTTGAWMVLIIIPLTMGMFLYIKSHYEKAAKAAELPAEELAHEFANLQSKRTNHVVVLAKDFDKRLLMVLRFAKTNIRGELRALHISADSNVSEFRKQWEEFGIDIPLDVVDSPYRELIDPLITYIRELRSKGDTVTVVLGEFAPEDSTDMMLHDQMTTFIKWALFKEPKTIVVSVPFTFRHTPFPSIAQQQAEDNTY